MKRIHMVISGRVQGVFFRAHTQEVAAQLNLTGWVRNTSSGDVEVVAEGKDEQLDKLISYCQRGPSAAKVDNVTITSSKATGEFHHFDIRYH